MTWAWDSLTVLSEQGCNLLRLLAVFTLGGVLMFGLLRRTLGETLDTAETLLLALFGWPVMWLLAALVGFLLARQTGFGPGWAVFLFSLFGLLLLPGWKRLSAPFGRVSPLGLGVMMAFLFSLFSRLAFLDGLLVPSYFDGALHFQIIQNLMTDFGRWPWEVLSAPVSGYYHIGFHLLTVSLAFATQLKELPTLLLLGQLMLAVLPFPVFLLVRRETGSTLAAGFAFLLAGWGWNMPAHAMNWGKYPALSSLLLLQFALCLALLATRPASDRMKWFFGGMFIVGALFAVLMHTRSAAVLWMCALAYWMAGFWQRFSFTWRMLLLAFLLGGLTALGAYLEAHSLLRLVFDPYLRAGLWMTLLVVALLPFGVRRFGRLTVTCLLALLFLLAALLLPVPLERYQTLLDRPFVQMTLYLPLAVLAGLGLAGLGKEPFPLWQRVWVTVAAFSAVFVSIGREYPFWASSCCILFRADDAVVLDWMKDQLPADAHILIAGNTLNVLPVESSVELRGVDGGVWIAPLTGRRVSMEHQGLDFTASETHRALCARGITHIYVGGGAERFDLTAIQARPEWFAPVLSLPGAHLFRVEFCQQNPALRQHWPQNRHDGFAHVWKEQRR